MDYPYVLPVWDTIVTAWEKVKGTKGTFWTAIFLIIAIWIASSFANLIISAIIPPLKPIIQFCVQVLVFLLDAGLVYIGIRCAFELPIVYTHIFRGVKANIAWRLIILYLLKTIIICPFVALLIVPPFILLTLVSLAGPTLVILQIFCAIIFALALIFGLMILIRMSLSTLFIIDKVKGPWEAIKLSFKATRGNFAALLGVFIIEYIFIIISVIPLGIGLIWTIPFGFITIGLIYKKLLVNASNLD